MKNFIEYINNLFGIDNQTSATIIITLSVFILGFLMTGLFNSIKTEIKRNSTRKFFKDLLREIARTADKQSRYFQDFSKILNIEHEGQFVLKSTPINLLDNIQKLSLENISDACHNGIRNPFTNKIRRKAFNKIWLHISSLAFWEERQVYELEKFINKFNEHENKRNEELENWRKISDQMMHPTNTQSIPAQAKPYYEEYDRIVYKWQTEGQITHYKKVQDELVDPLRELNRKYKDLPYTLLLNSPLLGVTNSYNNLKTTLDVYSNQYRSQYITYKAASRVISKSIKII